MSNFRRGTRIGGLLGVLAATAIFSPAHGSSTSVARLGLGLGLSLLGGHGAYATDDATDKESKDWWDSWDFWNSDDDDKDNDDKDDSLDLDEGDKNPDPHLPLESCRWFHRRASLLYFPTRTPHECQLFGIGVVRTCGRDRYPGRCDVHAM